MQDLRNRTIRAGFANLWSRAVIIALRIVSIVTLGRLLTPNDYGLFAMVTSFTGILLTLSGFGLFQAAVQHDTMTQERASTLFWVNLALGGMLTVVALALAPIVSAFYREPQLSLVTSVAAIGFVIIGAGIQHNALLQRQMRFGASALINSVAYSGATAIAIGMAWRGWGCWALVSMTISLPLANTLGAWLATGWIPGAPRLDTGMRPLVHFGGALTLKAIITYLSGNFEKFLLGRFWGAEIIGIYSRAQNLITFPTDILNSMVGEIAFAALSRAREDAERLRRYFVKGYALIIAVAVPFTTVAACFADDLIAVALGPQWQASAQIFRLLAPTIAVFSILTPLGWLLNSLGFVRRNLIIALASAPPLMIGIMIGLPYGPRGVAIACSIVAVLRVVPTLVWSVRDTPIRMSDIVGALRPPLVASFAAATIAYAAHLLLGPMLPLLLRLSLDITLFGIAYVSVLLLSKESRSLYLSMLRWWKMAPA
jgi:PST family polysaccharide transporter